MRQSLAVQVGSVTVGGGAPVSIQSMTNTDTADLEATLAQINRLVEAGCEIVRLAVPDEKAAQTLAVIKKNVNVPLVADIHFDYRLAIMAIKAGADKIRINPGNIGGEEKLSRIIDLAGEKGIPIRIGVNAGSIPREVRARHGGASAEALVETVVRTLDFFERHKFEKIVLSLKAADVTTMVQAYEEVARRVPYPLHLGITEAGRGLKGIVKSTLGIGALLLKGIGDTLRVSLTGDPVEEIPVAREILQAAGLRRFGPEIISCPTCARCEIDLPAVVDIVEDIIKKNKLSALPVKFAVMGCPVNGPGEAREADVGVSGGRGFAIIFKEGKVEKKVPFTDLAEALQDTIMELVSPAGNKTT
ncbi:MAG: flavodoxin-dependent (E)-4-hydroxy-3-methylbut-2-enyl-diphosphate synthase [Bacillota bacterium]